MQEEEKIEDEFVDSKRAVSESPTKATFITQTNDEETP